MGLIPDREIGTYSMPPFAHNVQPKARSMAKKITVLSKHNPQFGYYIFPFYTLLSFFPFLYLEGKTHQIPISFVKRKKDWSSRGRDYIIISARSLNSWVLQLLQFMTRLWLSVILFGAAISDLHVHVRFFLFSFSRPRKVRRGLIDYYGPGNFWHLLFCFSKLKVEWLDWACSDSHSLY